MKDSRTERNETVGGERRTDGNAVRLQRGERKRKRERGTKKGRKTENVDQAASSRSIPLPMSVHPPVWTTIYHAATLPHRVRRQIQDCR